MKIIVDTVANPRSRRLLAGAVFAASLAAGSAAFGYAVTASAAPCPPNSRATECCVQYGDIAGTNQTCRHEVENDGLLGGAPVVGNLPGLGGLL